VTTWLAAVQRLEFPQKTFAHAADAVAWLGARLDRGPVAGELGAALEAVRNAAIE
jgi:hypothetical protein